MLLLLACSASADQSVTVAWDASTDPEVTGAIVYYGNASRNYPYHTNVGQVTRATVYGLQAGLTYYFAVTVTNSAGLESDYSNEVSTSIPNDLTNSFPTISTISNRVMRGSGTIIESFTIGDAETPATNLHVTATSTNIALVANASLALSGTNETRYLAITPAKDKFGITLITVVVSDGAKASSTSFLLTVIDTPDPLPPSPPKGLRLE